MIEMHLKYDFKTFGSKPKRSIEKIDECKILFYAVTNDDVEIVIRCPDESIYDKLAHFLSIAYELFPTKKIIKN
jgi:hypothetical protein